MGISKHKDSAVLGNSDSSEIYWAQFRKHVFTLIKMGYDRLEASSLSDAEEPDITGELVRVMDEIIQDRNAPRWAWHLSIHDDPPVNKVSGKRGKRRPKIDLRIDRTGRGSRPSYQFEAKRLGSNHGVGKYVGSDGLGMFIAGTYGRECHEAGMLGYVQQDSTEVWADKIAGKLAQHKTSNTIGEWAGAKIVSKLESYRTQHERPIVGKSITIFHLLLPFK